MQICINYNRSASNTYTDDKMRKVREIPSSQWLILIRNIRNYTNYINYSNLQQLHQLHKLHESLTTSVFVSLYSTLLPLLSMIQSSMLDACHT